MSILSMITKEVRDDYKEHSQHKLGSWGKNKSNCSECYKAHKEFMASRSNGWRELDWREQLALDRHQDLMNR